MFNEEQRNILGLNRTENKILVFLKDESLNVSDLARKTHISRTSLYSMLKKLKARGFSIPVRKGKRWFWKMSPMPQIHEKIFSVLDELVAQPTEKEVGIIASQDSQYKIYRGKENLVRIYEEMGKLPRLSRLYVIQPNRSAYSVMKKFPHERLVKVNQNIKDRKIIVEAVLQENFLDYYASQLRKEKIPIEDIFKAYAGRLADTVYVSKEYLNFDSEIMFHSDFIIIANWLELVAVVIKNKEIAGIMKEMFSLVKNYGKKVDQNPRLVEILNRLNK